MDVSVVIVCMNRMDNLYPCLSTLHEHTSGVSYETFVVAYLFSPENLARAKADFPWVTFIESNEIRGFSENNNLALRQASGRYCFVLNDDTELSENVIGRLVSELESLPESAAIVSPTLLNADGSLQLCGRPAFTAWKYVRQQFHCYKEPIDTGLRAAGRTVQTVSISGAAFLIKTEVFRRLGWFDERYFFTPEDMALATLVRSQGFTIWVDTQTHITHKWRTTASKMMSATRPAAVRGSLIYFSETRPGHPSRLKYLALAVCVWIAETAKRIKAALRYFCHRTEADALALTTFRNITRSIFTTRSPKQIFIRYYRQR